MTGDPLTSNGKAVPRIRQPRLIRLVAWREGLPTISSCRAREPTNQNYPRIRELILTPANLWLVADQRSWAFSAAKKLDLKMRWMNTPRQTVSHFGRCQY